MFSGHLTDFKWDFAGESITFMLLFWWYFCSGAWVYFGSSSCRKTKWQLQLGFATESLRSSVKIFKYSPLVGTSSILTIFPVLDTLDPQSSFTVDTTRSWETFLTRFLSRIFEIFCILRACVERLSILPWFYKVWAVQCKSTSLCKSAASDSAILHWKLCRVYSFYWLYPFSSIKNMVVKLKGYFKSISGRCLNQFELNCLTWLNMKEDCSFLSFHSWKDPVATACCNRREIISWYWDLPINTNSSAVMHQTET